MKITIKDPKFKDHNKSVKRKSYFNEQQHEDRLIKAVFELVGVVVFVLVTFISLFFILTGSNLK